MGKLTGQCVLVTGAGQGIGRAVAARFLDEGAAVVLFERDAAAGEDARDALSARGEVTLHVLDVADDDAVRAAVREVTARREALHTVVNNAADQRGFGTPLEALAMADFRAVLDVNLAGPLHLVQQTLPWLRKARGSVINVASTRAAMSEPNTFAYSASKGGLVALTHALAISLGPEVRVNAIAPGWIATDAWRTRAERQEPTLSARDHAQHPVGRVGRPEDVAALAVFLASADAGFVTGQVWTVDGGMTRKMIYEE